MENYTPYKNRREFLLGLVSLIVQEPPAWDAVRSEQDWRRARDKTLAGMQRVMGDLPSKANSRVEVRRLESEELSGVTRIRIKYLSEPSDLTGWAGERYMPRIAAQYDKDPAKMPFDFPDLLSALAPRPVFINAPLHDANFDVSGVRDCVEPAAAVYDRVFRAKDRLVAIFPDAKHDFPMEVRAAAYSFLDRWLR